jgi:leucyl-tRNA synthetase
MAEKKTLSQWNLHIRNYAEEMLDSLELLDKWPNAVKDAQKGWIGKSKGVNVNFELKIN